MRCADFAYEFWIQERLVLLSKFLVVVLALMVALLVADVLDG